MKDFKPSKLDCGDRIKMFRLKVKHPNGSTRLYSEFGPDSLMQTLREQIVQDFALKASSMTLVMGHPPTKLDESGTLQACGLSDAQLISIVLPVEQKPAATSSSTNSKAKKVKPTKKRQKASSDEESSQGSEVLELEDDSEDDVDRRKRTPSGKSRAARPTTTTTTSSTGAAAANRNAPRPIKPFSGQIATLRQPKRKIRSTEELGETLAQSAAKNEPRDAVAKFFRKLTKNEVIKRYEIESANAKYAAVLSKQYEIHPAATAAAYRLSDGIPMEITLNVKYKRGRKFFEDIVQGLSEELLRETIRTVLHSQADPDDMLSHPREGLRPHALPLISPRVFWSLVHWKGEGGPGSIEKALITLLPGENWSFLSTRTRIETERSKQWKKTETILDRLERGLNPSDEAEENDDEDQDSELSEIIPSREERNQVRQKGITTVHQLADATPTDVIHEEWVDAAREYILPELMDEILGDCGQFARDRLNEIQIRTPSDVERLRIPGRTELVVEETKMSKDVVDSWQKKAKHAIQQHPWLDSIRTRG